MGKQEVYSSLYSSIEQIRGIDIPKERKIILSPFITYLNSKVGKKVQLNFICTHNSRRSQLGQVWAQVAAHYYGFKIDCYSGGTEATAFYPMAVNTLKRQGFQISSDGMDNPKYIVSYTEGKSVTCFSKVYDSDFNPSKDFAAILTCSHADENCPIIQGAEIRIPLDYQDPKKYDGTELAESMYEERSLQIASEMFYVFESVNNKQ